ncbi:LAME_0E00276g1_1 [Lachancea meyersii CBS 8951]|uniref:PAN2-PAN3 deadenylation complex subunit PAN3 n=1 Tax=Lachancea meyersii CBS 8951 TaxID=1266667 RepID=A0A1G4JEY8_9SACH|nr:LAME_0E00276g1_1 [Lachancea meyersii CBS 8951]
MDKANAEWAKDIPCKNITIYGFCKYENEGCIFNHGKDTNSGISSRPALNSSLSSKFNAKTAPSFTPSKALNAKTSSSTAIKAEKVAKALQSVADQQPAVSSPLAAQSAPFASSFNPYAANFTPVGSAGAAGASSPPSSAPAPAHSAFNPYSASGGLSTPGDELNPMQSSTGFMSGSPGPFAQESSNRHTNFPSIYPPSHSILQYHLYAADPPLHLKLPLKPNERSPEMLFIPNDIREELLKKNQAALQVFPSGGNLPEIVGDYFGLVPLEFHNRVSKTDRYQGHQNSLYKVFSNFDGKIYIMRRVHDVKILETSQISQPFQNWKKLVNCNVAEIRDAFITRAFNDSSLCVVHDYFPQSSSLYETHFVNFSPAPLTQDLLWSYLVQLCSAVQAAHSLNLAFNNICLDKVIVTGSPGRIKISDSCVHDILHFQEDVDIVQQQQNDFSDMGSLLRDLSSKILGSNHDATAVDAADHEFRKILNYLLDPSPAGPKSLNSLLPMFAHKILSVTSALQTSAEYTESILARELENARLFRLMCKLNFIFGRTESRIDINWSEAGDKFPIILFYDYVFHQSNELGRPVMDLTHVLRCLNRLDAGTSEKLMLVTPDEMNCIIISYKELKDLIDSAFRAMSQ